MLGVYIHIPFCESKCLYCAFSSFVENEKMQEEYINYLVKEIENFQGEQKIDTIYIGGGTPSILPVSFIQKVFSALKSKFVFAENYEFTIEANPCSLTEEKLICYKNNGINRISLGVQSLNDAQLQFIGRKHNSLQALDAIKLAKKHIDNVSCDLLIGLKDMLADEFCNQVETLSSLGVDHVSAYMLQVESGTPLEKLVNQNSLLLPDDDESVSVYEQMVKRLQSLGYNRYEVSNFARNDRYSRHNYKYWTGEDYIGFGLGAHSYIKGRRFANSSNFEGYFKGELSNDEILNDNQKLEEHIMLGLRCQAGISKHFLLNLGYNIEKNENYQEFLQKGILQECGDKTTLNPDFYGINNYIIIRLLP